MYVPLVVCHATTPTRHGNRLDQVGEDSYPGAWLPCGSEENKHPCRCPGGVVSYGFTQPSTGYPYYMSIAASNVTGGHNLDTVVCGYDVVHLYTGSSQGAHPRPVS